MKKGDAKYVLNKIDNEGFDYCFDGYSEFLEIKDQKFHILRKTYLNVMNELFNYLTDQSENGEEGGIDE